MVNKEEKIVVYHGGHGGGKRLRAVREQMIFMAQKEGAGLNRHEKRWLLKVMKKKVLDTYIADRVTELFEKVVNTVNENSRAFHV